MSSNELPFIKKFKIDNKFYIYDVNTNAFLKVDELVYYLIDKGESNHPEDLRILKKYPKKKKEEVIKNIDLMRKKGYFSNHRPKITCLHTLTKDALIDYIKDILNNRLYKITIVLDERCNMRCRYCAYSGIYLYNRKHSNKSMTPKVMRQAVDFYFSHSSAIRNLKKMKALYPEYYQTKVRFNIVIHPPLNFDRINEFIYDPGIKPASIRFSDLNNHFTTFFKQFNSDQMEAFRRNKRNIRNSFYRKVINNEELNEVEKSLFRTKFLYIHRRDMNRLPDLYPSNGQCILGERTLFVNIDGSLNFCSRIDDSFNLGNVFTGYDYKSIEKIYFDMESLFSEKCFGCWAIRFCMKCINDINKNGEVNKEVFNRICSSRKETILNEIKDYINIRESNFHALDYLEEVSIS